MAALPALLPYIAAGASATATIAETAQQRAIGKAQAQATEEAARAVGLETTAQVEAQRREARRLAGEQRAAGAQMGMLESPTFLDVTAQSNVAAELDSLMLAYQGETQRKSLMTEAAMTRAARPKWGPAILSAGTNALMAFAGTGGKLPSGGGKAAGVK